MNSNILLNGQWKVSKGTAHFKSFDPRTRQAFTECFPISPWSEVENVIAAAHAAGPQLYDLPAERFAILLEKVVDCLLARRNDILASAHRETALPLEPRLEKNEFPRTTKQLLQAAAAARSGTWCMPTIDKESNIRSMLGPIGPVIVFGPNNFPLAFNPCCGGGFAAAIAAGNPVIAVGHRSHPYTSALLAQCVLEASHQTGMPDGLFQFMYGMESHNGLRLVADERIGATDFTGSRKGGLALKAAADAAGRPIYLELGGVNSVFLLPGALVARMQKIVDEFVTSVLMGVGQFCTKPGLIIVPTGDDGDLFVKTVVERFPTVAHGFLLSEVVETNFFQDVAVLLEAGASLLTGGGKASHQGFGCVNALLSVNAVQFLENPKTLQREVFGPVALFVRATPDQMPLIAAALEGGLTGTIYDDGASDGDRKLRDAIRPILRRTCGRMNKNKMPTGVAVVPSMNHGGPFPATSHPGFTGVGIPASLRRFGMLQCFDNWSNDELPAALQDENPLNWGRMVDGNWVPPIKKK